MRATTATLLAFATLGLAACGDDDSSSSRSFVDRARDVGTGPPPEQPPPRPAKEEGKPNSEAEAEAEAESGAGTGRGSPATDPAAPQEFEGGDHNDRKIRISSSDFPPGTWPLTIESGELRCEDSKNARTIIFSANGQDYPVNGVPEGGRIIGIEPIWKEKDHPQSAGTRMDITPLFKKGYELCGD